MKIVTRKQVAMLLMVSVDIVRRNEKALRLRRININKRLIFYPLADVAACLKRWETGVE